MAGSPGRNRKRVNDSWGNLNATDEAASQLKTLARSTPAGFAMYASKGQWQIARHLAVLNELVLEMAVGNIRHAIVSMPPVTASQSLSASTPRHGS